MSTLEMAKALLDAPMTCAELKTAAENYINSVGTEMEKEFGKALVEQAEEDLMTNESVIAFFSSDKAKELFGEEKATQILAHHKQLLANGVKYCDCPACTAAKQIIDNKDLFL